MSVSVLPIVARRGEIEAMLREHRVLVLTGETGSGKTTQVPRIVWEMQRQNPPPTPSLRERALKANPPPGPLPPPALGGGAIAHTQPRRLAARAVAGRIAEEMQVRLGGLVGYKVRFESKVSRETAITVMTDGVLLAEVAQDPDLSAYSTVILDEAHERSLNIDLLLGHMKRLLTRRSDLRLIVTSATIEPRRFSEFFGGPSVAPVLEVAGRNFGVEVRYRATRDHEEELPEVSVGAVVDAVEEMTGPRGEEGDVLVFLPGEREIRRVAEELRRAGVDADVLPLFSRLSNAEQDRIFHWSPGGRTRVVLATNVAETSLTVPGIRHVVDTGLERRDFYDAGRKVQTLPIVRVSRASADQRKGRCGRVAAGVCVRLYSEASYRARAAFTEPAIRRTSLAGAILQTAAVGLGSLEDFPLLDPPEKGAVKEGYETLVELGAVRMKPEPGSENRATEHRATITGVGRRMARMPVEPRIARIMIAGEDEGCPAEATVLAAGLSIQDPRERPIERQRAADAAHEVFRDEASDFLTLLNVYDQYRYAAETMGSGAVQGWCREHFVNAGRMREWHDMVRQLEEYSQSPRREPGGVDDEAKTRFGEPGHREPGHAEPELRYRIHRALLTGLISNLACRNDGGSFDYKGVKGNVVALWPGSVLFKKGPKWIIAGEMVETTRLYARTVGGVEPEWIEELAGHVLDRQWTDAHLDADTGEPSVWERATINGIVVVPRRRVPLAGRDAAKARGLFIREALVLGKWKGAGGYVARVRGVMEKAAGVAAKLRRRGVVRPEAELVAWFEKLLPTGVVDPSTVVEWRAAHADEPGLGVPSVEEVLAAGVSVTLEGYPDEMVVEGIEKPVPLSYAFAPGEEEDGVTATVGLADLGLVSATRAAWLVPGMLAEVVGGLIKLLPKPARASLEAKGELSEVARGLAEVLQFGKGGLPEALSEAASVLHGVEIEPGAWTIKALPTSLRVRVRVVDESGNEVASERDVAALAERLAGKSAKARAARARGRFEREGIVAWDFGALPELFEADGGQGGTLSPALVDEGKSCRLTLMESAAEAGARTALGVRRLFALACAEQVGHDLEAMPTWADLCRFYGHFGSPAALKADLTCLIAERAFMGGGGVGVPRSAEEFESRQQAGWGRLSQVVRDTADVVLRILEPRAKVAGRLAGGTSRHWAASVADLREQSAYLMPPGFLLLAPWERLREYPRYVGAMRERLFALREDGSGAEKQLLEKFLPHWKKFTAWVAAGMSAEREFEPASPAGDSRGKTKSALPQAKRAAPTVNADAGAWAMSPGRLPTAVERYRWALEEWRLVLFTPDLAGKSGVTAGVIEGLAKGL
jgi:ATP-dependent helicase HrpA